MTPLSAIAERQNSLLQLYQKLEKRFEENNVIRTLWRDMAGDVSLQIQSLKSFPSSFWNQFKNAPDDGFESAVKSVSPPPSDVTDISLRNSFELSLQMAEPVVLKIYARVIRLLRKNSTAPALNFYILVKAYVARLVRTTNSFAGDPLLIRRAELLMLELEREAQEPSPEIKALASRALSAKEQKTAVSKKAAADKSVKAVKEKETEKPPSKNVKADASKPVKAAPVKAKAVSKKTPAATRRA
ncbi:MAG: hypothetical protein LBJ21_06760 [Acidobacteriota bacterium]|jgi:hypothetical protein|nr:hypothetical protein [Acidobacteriota bacterium]